MLYRYAIRAFLKIAILGVGSFGNAKPKRKSQKRKSLLTHWFLFVTNIIRLMIFRDVHSWMLVKESRIL
ncbi:hypothetical protein HanPI659440_Chr14g0525461 [Helianthus annuus]|nr:hypothetical protein HanPI659440_Chr14g0525461 [Helianthus annuus]